MDGYNNGMNNDFQHGYPNFQQQMPAVPSTNGKQIAGMILGIVCLVESISAFFTTLIIMISAGVVKTAAQSIKNAGGIYVNTSGTNVTQLTSSAATGLVLAIVAVALAIVVFVLYNKVKANGDVTKKIRVGKGLATAGCIIGGISLIFGIIGTATAASAVSILQTIM